MSRPTAHREQTVPGPATNAHDRRPGPATAGRRSAARPDRPPAADPAPAGSLTRRRFVRGLGASAVLGAVAPGLWAAGRASRPPNVVHFMTDDQGWADVGYMGLRQVKTPNLDAMAANGLAFTRFYAPAPVCTPSRISITMGRHCTRYGRVTVGPCDVPPFDKPKQIAGPPDNITIAEGLKRRGYVTAHYGKGHGASMAGMDDRETYGNARSPEDDLRALDKALAFIRQAAAADKPFYLQVWTSAPHKQYTPTDEHLALYGGDRFGPYWAEITLTDQMLGSLRKELRRLGIEDDTLLWFCSDNGGHGVHQGDDLRDGKGSLYEGGIRVPGVIEYPGLITEAARTDVPASGLDVIPTVFALAGVPMPRYELDGVSLVPLLRGEMKQRPKAIPFWFVDHSRQTTPHFALVDNRYKLLSNLGRDGQAQLYDLAEDPREKHDLAAADPERVATMRDDLARWKAAVERSMAGGA